MSSEVLIPSRRGFLAGAIGLLAAPAIVSASSLMPIKGFVLEPTFNRLLTPEMITREAVKLFCNSNYFLKNIEEQYDWQFGVEGAKIGTALRIRLPVNYAVQNGPSIGLADPVAEYLTAQIAPALPVPTLTETAVLAAGAALASNPEMSRRGMFAFLRSDER